jgi:NADH:ubiquinone oxidoreductase subunit 5 (subunit L)/multisubunit Na+/H+ antiporter MnhA subunit
MHALVFYRKAHSYTELSVGAPTHEAKASMVIPLCVLALASIFSGYILKDSMVGIGTHFWCNLPAYTSNAQHTYICDSEFAYQDGYTLVDSFAPWLPIILSILGAILGSLMPTHISANALASYLYTIRLPQVYSGVIRFITQRWLYDKITNDILARTSMVFAYHVSFKTLDKGFITIFGPYGIPRVLTQLASSLRNLQSGMIYHYAFIMVIALMHAITQVCGIAGYTSATPVYVKLLLMCVLIYLLESKRPYATHAHA